MTSVFADVSSPALKCLCKVCEGGVAVPWWGFVPLAMAQCRALSSATDSDDVARDGGEQQLNEWDCPLQLPFGHTISLSGHILTTSH